MTQIGEGIAVTQITDPDKPHWVQVEYKYANGKPVKGRFIATDSSGMTWAGILNDKGQACLSGLPPGSVEFELVAEDTEAELKQMRASIKTVLDGIIAEQKAEAAKHEKELAQQNALMQAGSHYWAYTKGFWNGAVGLVTFAKDVVVKTAEVAQYLSPLERINNLLHAGYKSYQDGTLTSAQWKQNLAKNLQDEEIKDIAHILGIDARHLSPEGLQQLKELFAEAYEITAFIADDKESLDLLTQFGKDYAGAQSSIEWAEFAGGGVFEIVLAALLLMFTGGAGNIAQGASKIRHAGKLKSLGSIFRNLGKLLKRKKLRRKIRVNVDTKKPVQTELPKDKKIASADRNNKKKSVGRSLAEERAHVKNLSQEAAEAEKRGDLKLRDAKIAEARSFLSERVLDNPDIPNADKPKALIDRLDVSSPKDKAVFWSGDKNAAKQLAKEIDGVCLETTNGGRIIDDWPELNNKFPGWAGDPPPNGFDFWGGVSEKYASGVTGDVRVIQTAERAAQGGGYVWKNAEKAVLENSMESGSVTKIINIVL